MGRDRKAGNVRSQCHLPPSNPGPCCQYSCLIFLFFANFFPTFLILILSSMPVDKLPLCMHFQRQNQLFCGCHERLFFLFKLSTASDSNHQLLAGYQHQTFFCSPQK